MSNPRHTSIWAAVVFGALVLTACGDETEAPAPEAEPQGFAAVDGARILNADAEPGSWLSHGRTYDEQRFSPLVGVNDRNVDRLGLAWSLDLDTTRGVEASPIIVDGVMFTTSAWSVVHALDARTGELKWTYDPQVDKAWGVYACCDVVNRGVAVWQGAVFVGALDGRLIALDAATGAVNWSVDTIEGQAPYTITGAPRVVNGNVIIGNGGAEYGVRGYVTAYDAATGDETWRFYTVPGNPADGFESDAMRDAADTWNGNWWELGGGGTVWDSMAYDAELDLLYIGVGNGSPWNQGIRSPGGGDNLFLSSIVALRPDTGEYVWHYQTTPGDTWDYTATQHMVLADIEIDGAVRQVLMQAPKNGFFYVLDRATGELISAEPFVTVSWASHVDLETGRPVETPGARYYEGAPSLQFPSPYGGHNWHPMSFSPMTGLVYIPAQEIPAAYIHDPAYEERPGRWNAGVAYVYASMPDDATARAALRPLVRGHLSAWDPATQTEAWRVEHAGPWNGGLLSTAGNLVFQGTANARFVAYAADTGAELWSMDTQTGIVAAPVTYELDGEQYVTVMVGWGGTYPLVSGYFVDDASHPAMARVLTFKLDANGTLPELDWTPPVMPQPPVIEASDETLWRGKTLYHANCQFCHGDSAVGGGRIRDLRFSGALSDGELWRDIVVDGALADIGMASFASTLDADGAEAVRAYVAGEAQRAQTLADASAEE